MLKKTLRPILKIRSYWRNISFDEVAVLYLSKNMRLFAIKLTSAFNLSLQLGLFYSGGFSLSTRVFYCKVCWFNGVFLVHFKKWAKAWDVAGEYFIHSSFNLNGFNRRLQ